MKLLPIRGWNNKKDRKSIIVGYTKVDDENIDTLLKYNWSFTGHNKESLYVENSKLGKLHRFIMKYPKNKDVDHINRDRLDNRKCNLRICTRSQNMMNVDKRKNNTSGYKNISWCSVKNKWMVQISLNGKRKTIGRYKDIKKAIKIRNKALKKYHKQFACFN